MENVGASPLALAGIRFTTGVRFDFTAGMVETLRPGELALVVRNASAVADRYRGRRMRIAGWTTVAVMTLAALALLVTSAV